MKKPSPQHFMKYEVTLVLSPEVMAQIKRNRESGYPPRELLGAGIYSLPEDEFPENTQFKAIGLTYPVYEDNSRELCWMVFDVNGTLHLKSISKFSELGAVS